MPGISASSPRQARRQRELESRRADLLTIATEVFAERGFEGAQVSEIASRAEISLATLYGFFQGKEELYRAVLAEVSQGIFERLGELVAGVEDPVDSVLAIVDGLCRIFDEERDFLHLFMRDTTAMPWRFRQDLGEEGLAIFDQFIEWVAIPARQAQEQGRLKAMSPETFSVFLLGGVSTALMRALEEDSGRSLLELGSGLRAGISRVFEQPQDRRRRRGGTR